MDEPRRVHFERVVSRDPEVLGGELVFAGTRVPVKNLVEHLAAGDSIEDFLEGFPGVGRQQIEGYLETTLKDAESRLLVGRPVRASVGEPWDFSSEAGEGALTGAVVAVSDEGEWAGGPPPNLPLFRGRGGWVELEVSTFAAEGGRRAERVTAIHRYEMARTVPEQLRAGYHAGVHLYYEHLIPEEERDPDRGYYLIGGVLLDG